VHRLMSGRGEIQNTETRVTQGRGPLGPRAAIIGSAMTQRRRNPFGHRQAGLQREINDSGYAAHGFE